MRDAPRFSSRVDDLFGNWNGMRMGHILRRCGRSAIVHKMRLLDAAAPGRNGRARIETGPAITFRVNRAIANASGRRRRGCFLFGNTIHFRWGFAIGLIPRQRNAIFLVQGVLGRLVIMYAHFTGVVVILTRTVVVVRVAGVHYGGIRGIDGRRRLASPSDVILANGASGGRRRGRGLLLRIRRARVRQTIVAARRIRRDRRQRNG